MPDLNIWTHDRWRWIVQVVIARKMSEGPLRMQTYERANPGEPATKSLHRKYQLGLVNQN